MKEVFPARGDRDRIAKKLERGNRLKKGGGGGFKRPENDQQLHARGGKVSGRGKRELRRGI